MVVVHISLHNVLVAVGRFRMPHIHIEERVGALHPDVCLVERSEVEISVGDIVYTHGGIIQGTERVLYPDQFLDGVVALFVRLGCLGNALQTDLTVTHAQIQHDFLHQHLVFVLLVVGDVFHDFQQRQGFAQHGVLVAAHRLVLYLETAAAEPVEAVDSRSGRSVGTQVKLFFGLVHLVHLQIGFGSQLGGLNLRHHAKVQETVGQCQRPVQIGHDTGFLNHTVDILAGVDSLLSVLAPRYHQQGRECIQYLPHRVCFRFPFAKVRKVERRTK